MKKYLLDTNICIYYLKGLYQLDKKVDAVERVNCLISEITVAELKFGVENSKTADTMLRPIIEAFIPLVCRSAYLRSVGCVRVGESPFTPTETRNRRL